MQTKYTMSTTEIKQHLHQYIDKADQRFLNMIYALTKEYANYTVVLSAEEKKAADKGLASIAKGKTVPHAKVISTMKKKYPSLKFK